MEEPRARMEWRLAAVSCIGTPALPPRLRDKGDTVSKVDAERFKSNATECRRQAAEAMREDDQKAWVRLADEWDKLSEDAQQRRGIFDRYEQ
jgi:hypothetical protein